MNIFATDINPSTAARNLCDKHINKMIVESAQMLANGFALDRMAQGDCPRNQKGEPRSHGYSKHPCTLWCYETRGNMEWLVEHALEMGEKDSIDGVTNQNTFLYGSFNGARTTYMIPLALKGGLKDFAIAISDTMNCRKVDGFDDLSSIEKYRFYYRMDKPFVKWTKRKKPSWF